MRILHVSQPTDGGTAVVVRELARRSLAQGDHVVVACPDQGFLADWTRSNGAVWQPVPLTRRPGLADLRAIGTIRRLAAGADVVHLHSSMAGAVGRLSALGANRARPRIVFTAHGWSWYVGGRAAPLYKAIERALSPMADAIVVVSDQELADGRAVLGPKAPLHLVPNGVDLESFRPEGPAAERPTTPLLVQVGRLSRQKGQDRAIRTLALLGRSDVTLRLVGDGDIRAELMRLSVTLGVGSQVEFVAASDPRPHLRAADVVVLPSRWEGMPLTLLEAMGTGRAVVTTDVGGSEAVEGVGAVVSGASEDEIVDSLAREVARLLASETVRADLGRRARARCEQGYDLTATLDTYQRLWTSQ